jgi:DNA modification methylase
MPWRLAFALQADGWWLRQDIIWCLSGGTWVYARTQKGDMPIMVRDLARLRPETAQLWNGEKWTRLLGTSKSKRRGTELELVLRSGERISCTPTHKFPTSRGLLKAADIRIGDKLTSCRLPEPANPKSSVIDNDAAWLAGLYLAEGSMSGDTIQIAGHSKEVSRWIRLCAIATKYGGSCTQSVDGNKMNIRLYGKVLVAILSELVTGRTAKNKGFAPVVWRHSDSFVGSMLSGYLSGDGAYSKERWRLGFTRNYNLERDLRTACARLGYTITLNPSTVEYKGKRVLTFRGEIRETRSGHHNEKDRNEVMVIRKARCREVYDLGVEDGPHVFALASGVLTHNSKPNPMPESVTDRCTKAHEYLFLLTKSAHYYYDAEAIKEPAADSSLARWDQDIESQYGSERVPGKTNGTMKAVGGFDRLGRGGSNSRMHQDRDPSHPDERKIRTSGNKTHKTVAEYERSDSEEHRTAAGLLKIADTPYPMRNKRSVWEIATQPFKEAHFATFPMKLVEPCILAGTSEKGCCPKCGAPWSREVDRVPATSKECPKTVSAHIARGGTGTPVGTVGKSGSGRINGSITTIGWYPSCSCNKDDGGLELEPIPCTVLDPFSGSATTGLVAVANRCNYIGIELNPEYAAMSRRRLEAETAQGVLL